MLVRLHVPIEFRKKRKKPKRNQTPAETKWGIFIPFQCCLRDRKKTEARHPLFLNLYMLQKPIFFHLADSWWVIKYDYLHSRASWNHHSWKIMLETFVILKSRECTLIIWLNLCCSSIWFLVHFWFSLFLFMLI